MREQIPTIGCIAIARRDEKVGNRPGVSVYSFGAIHEAGHHGADRQRASLEHVHPECLPARVGGAPQHFLVEIVDDADIDRCAGGRGGDVFPYISLPSGDEMKLRPMALMGSPAS